MSTYLLRWNPAEWPADQFEKYFNSFEIGESLRWACGTTKKIAEGDRFFLVKSGKDGKGVIGSGRVVRAPYIGLHYKATLAACGETTLFVGVQFDYLTKPNGQIPVARHELDSPDLADSIWDTQGTGKIIPESIAAALEELWTQRVPLGELTQTDELDLTAVALKEGAKRQIQVNAYERSADARRRCLDKWGMNCVVCSFRFDLNYGPLGKGFMHVHHLVPLAEIGEEYEIDPVKDLRPVCPNCHAMLHRRRPPLSIEELKTIFSRYSK